MFRLPCLAQNGMASLTIPAQLVIAGEVDQGALYMAGVIF